MPPDQYEHIELATLEVGSSSSEPPAPVQPSRQAWHPKLTPYRLLSVLLPVCLGTVKAVALQQGQEDEPIMLEWISGVVVFIVLFTTGTYECRPIQHIPAYLAWLFEYDCMDAVWWLRFTISQGLLTRPRYISDEIKVEAHGTIYMVTSYRLLVCATVVSIGMLKAALTYGAISTGATWVEWILGVVSSALYIIGLYESNTIGLWPSFFGTDRAYVTWNGLTGTLILLSILLSLIIMSTWFRVEVSSKSVVLYTDTELPVILRGYNLSMIILINGGLMICSLFGAVILFVTLMLTYVELRDRVRVLLRIEVFVSWIASFASSAYGRLPLSSRPHSSMFTFARSWAGVRSFTYTLRHLLKFLVASFFIFVALSSFAGQVYRCATGDLSTIDGYDVSIEAVLFGLSMHGSIGMSIIILAGHIVVPSLRKMRRSTRNVYAARIAPSIRRARGKAGEKAQQIKRRVQRRAGHTVLRLSGLLVVEDVHYAFLELVWMLHADAEVAHIWL